MDASFLSSQSHFAKFEGFTPDNGASFENEFSRLASSQSWIPGSQQYTKERTIALREELKQHYFSHSNALDGSEGHQEEDELRGYQDLCREVKIVPGNSVLDCKKALKGQLVNIVDLIDARRTGKEVEIWQDFEAFRHYTLRDEHRISIADAKEDGGYLESLLQRLRGRRPRKHRKRGGAKGKVCSGRVTKTTLE